MTIVDAILWNLKTQKMASFEVMTTFEGIYCLSTYHKTHGQLLIILIRKLFAPYQILLK